MPPPRWHRDSAPSYKFRSSSAVRTSSPLSLAEANPQTDEMDVSVGIVNTANGTSLDGYEPDDDMHNDMQGAPREDYPGLTETPSSEIPTDPMLMADQDGMLPEEYYEEQPEVTPSQLGQEDEEGEPMGEIPIDPAMIDPALMAGTASQRVSEPRSTSEEPTGTIEVHDPSAQVSEDTLMQDVEQTDFAPLADSTTIKSEDEAGQEDNGYSGPVLNGSAGESSDPQPESGNTSISKLSDEVQTTSSTQDSISSPAHSKSASQGNRSSPPETRAKSTELKSETKLSESVSSPIVNNRREAHEKEQEPVLKTPKPVTSSEITTRSSAYKGSSSPEMTRTTRRSKAAQEQAELAAHVRQKLSEKPIPSTPSKKEQVEKATSEPDKQSFKSQPRPVGRWAHLTPYVDGEFTIYPEKKVRSDDETNGDDQSPDDKDDKETNDMEPMVEDNDDPQATEAPTPVLNTPRRGSPAPDSGAITAFGSPAPAAADDGEDDVSDNDEPQRARHFRYRKLRDAEDYVTALENYEDMSTADLYAVLEAVNVSMVQWQTEWTGLGKKVDDYENALRRRAADTKYESRTRNLHQHNFNYEEPDFAVKGYKAKEKEIMSETRYLQGQDRIMAATYGFEYDPHPSKIGRQNPELQQEGMVTRGRMLRNHPRQTVKASEGDEPTGKRTRKPVQLFDPATQDVSRSSTPVPTRGRRRKNAAADADEVQPAPPSSVNGNAASDDETGVRKTRRRRGRAKAEPDPEEPPPTVNTVTSSQEEPTRSVRRGRGRPGPRYDDMFASPSGGDKTSPPGEKEEPRRLLTLKIPRGKHFDDATSAMTDNGDSRPSTADSESSSHTVESSYSFRPKRQKRFRDEPEESPTAVSQQPPKKRRNRTSGAAVFASKESLATPTTNNSEGYSMEGSVAAMPSTDPFVAENPANAGKKPQKIKVVRAAPQNDSSRYGTPTTLMSFNSEDGDEPPKDYKSMTKSEKMSASMKSRWANGNMAGAVEKRKATLAAKKAAQAAAEARVGAIAPKPQPKRAKKDPMEQQRQQQQQPHHPPQHQHQHPHLQPQLHHHHHHQQHPHMQHMQPIQPHHHQPLQPHPPPPHHHQQQQQPPPPPPPHHEGQGRFQGFPSRFHAFIANPWGPPGPPPQM